MENLKLSLRPNGLAISFLRGNYLSSASAIIEEQGPFLNAITTAHKPVSVNHEEVEFGLTVSNFTTWLKSLPLLTPTQTKGNSCSGTTSISNNLSGQGTGKSMC